MNVALFAMQPREMLLLLSFGVLLVVCFLVAGCAPCIQMIFKSFAWGVIAKWISTQLSTLITEHHEMHVTLPSATSLHSANSVGILNTTTKWTKTNTVSQPSEHEQRLFCADAKKTSAAFWNCHILLFIEPKGNKSQQKETVTRLPVKTAHTIQLHVYFPLNIA